MTKMEWRVFVNLNHEIRLWFQLLKPTDYGSLVLTTKSGDATTFHLYQQIDQIIRLNGLQSHEVMVEETKTDKWITEKPYDLGNPYG